MTAPIAYLPVEVDFPAMLFVAENTDSRCDLPHALRDRQDRQQRVTVTRQEVRDPAGVVGRDGRGFDHPVRPVPAPAGALSLAFHMDSVAVTTVTSPWRPASTTPI